MSPPSVWKRDRPHADDFARDGDVDRLVRALALDLEPGLGIDRTLHLVDGLLERQPLNLVVVDLGDQVAGQDAGLGRRRVVHRRHDLDQAVLHRDLDAEPAELAVGRLLHVLPGLVIHVTRMRVQRGDHAVDGAFDQLAVVGLLDIVGPDPLEHLAEQIELRIGVSAHRGPGDADRQRALGRRDEQGQASARRRTEEKQDILAHCSKNLLAISCRPPRTGISASRPAAETRPRFTTPFRYL